MASIVLCQVFLEQHTELPGESIIRTVGFLTVLLSIYAHGISALPGIAGYTRKLTELDPSAPEFDEEVAPSLA